MKHPILFLICATIYGHPGITELQPVQSIYTHYSPEYSNDIRKLLFSQIAPEKRRNIILQLLILPSHNPEGLLSLHLEKGKYYIEGIRPQTPIWGISDDSRANLEYEKYRLEITPILAEKMNRAWGSELKRVSYQEPTAFTVDGASFIFIYRDTKSGITLEGEATSPDEGTRPHILVNIGYSLYRIVMDSRGNHSEHVSFDRIDKELELLINKK